MSPSKGVTTAANIPVRFSLLWSISHPQHIDDG
jgi:hypothetical protein